jgi:hypothetical protein
MVYYTPSTKGVIMAEPSITNVPRAEADIANSGPAAWSNKFIVSVGHAVRIAFLEQGGPNEPIYFRSAAMVSHQDAIALKNLLVTLLADIEKQIQSIQTGGGTPPNG